MSKSIKYESRVFKSHSEFGRDALKAAMIINGGAAVALLAFIGNIPVNGVFLENLLIQYFALLSFCMGVFLAGLSSYFSFKLQMVVLLYQEEKKGFDSTKDQEKKNEIQDKINTIAINYRKLDIRVDRFLFSSYLSFFVGVLVFCSDLLMFFFDKLTIFLSLRW